MKSNKKAILPWAFSCYAETMNNFDSSNRRQFLRFMGRGSVALWSLRMSGLFSTSVLSACSTAAKKVGIPLGKKLAPGELPFQPLAAQVKDELVLADGFTSEVFICWGDGINAREQFGFNCDFIGFVPFQGAGGREAYMWVNHETPDPQFVSGFTADSAKEKTKEQVEKEMKSTGGSLLHARQETNGKWTWVRNSKINRRWDAMSPIAFSPAQQIQGGSMAMGTLANCAGGITPWGHFLTCEENYHYFYGEAEWKNGERTVKPSKYHLKFDSYYGNPPEHYGWVVEIDPQKQIAKKLVSLGRFAHEGATCVKAKDGRTVVYMGDDTNNECFYKFIASSPGQLDEGTLYVADCKKGRWLPLDIRHSKKLKKEFKDQQEVLIRAREAAHLLGGTRLDRPEDCEIDPKSGAVIVACTMNTPEGRPFGSLMKLEEEGRDPLALKFKWSQFIAGGPQTGFSCPDNLVFDRNGNLWMTSDVPDEDMNKGAYAFQGNNSLYYIPMSGPRAGQAYRVASAPMDAEFTGPCFSPDGKTLFLSVQHPGANSKGLNQLTSHWPEGGKSVPKPSVVTIQGPALEALTQV